MQFVIWELRHDYELTSIRFLSTVSLFNVKVPVLSLQSTSMPAISSMAVILFVMAPYSSNKRLLDGLKTRAILEKYV